MTSDDLFCPRCALFAIKKFNFHAVGIWNFIWYNEYSEIFEGSFPMTIFKEMSHIYEELKIKF